MFKHILLSSLVCASLSAQSFEIFLQNALQNSPYLQANNLNKEQAQEFSSLTTRYKNPTLELEASNFSPDLGESEIGYRFALRQPIRLWGVSANREDFAAAKEEQSLSLVRLKRAEFVREISLVFSEYKSALSAEVLAKEELIISEKIVEISKARYKNGTVARVKYLQAKVDQHRVKNRLDELAIKRLKSYYKLLTLSGLSEEVEIGSDYIFTLSVSSTTENSAELNFAKTEVKSSLSSAQLSANKIEWIDLVGEFEQEPNQSIARLGVEIPLAVFNTKSEEKKISQIEAKKSELLVQNLTNTTMLKLKEIKKSLTMLEKLQKSTQILLDYQEELLKMYEDAYKVANIDLIELQIVKNQMIQTESKAIEIQLSLEQKIIEHNFLTGEYNE